MGTLYDIKPKITNEYPRLLSQIASGAGSSSGLFCFHRDAGGGRSIARQLVNWAMVHAVCEPGAIDRLTLCGSKKLNSIQTTLHRALRVVVIGIKAGPYSTRKMWFELPSGERPLFLVRCHE